MSAPRRSTADRVVGGIGAVVLGLGLAAAGLSLGVAFLIIVGVVLIASSWGGHW